MQYYDSGEDDDGDADSDNGDSDEADNTGSPADRGRSVAQPAGLPELRGKSLIPTFGFNCKKPNYAQIFEENVLILESLNITEDFCLMGNIRVNMTKLRAINREQEAVASTTTSWGAQAPLARLRGAAGNPGARGRATRGSNWN